MRQKVITRLKTSPMFKSLALFDDGDNIPDLDKMSDEELIDLLIMWC